MDDKLPPPIKITPSSPDTSKTPNGDDPIFEAKINNPFSKFFNWIKKLIQNEGIRANFTIKPLTAMLITTTFATFFTGTGFSIAKIFFPNSSPILHREVAYQGKLQKTDTGQYILSLSDSSLYTVKPKLSTNLSDLPNKLVLVKGNLTKTPYVIENAEIISLGIMSEPPITPTSLPTPTSLTTPTSELKLPDLFTGLQWVSTQKKVLVFTSGKRRMDVEGFHIESSQLTFFPQDFINYYITELKNRGFKETLNSIDPEGIIVTYSKDDLFLTFGVKNIYQGKADKKQLAGYVAYLEHN